MKVGLKKKYKWKERASRFAIMDLQKRIHDNMLRQLRHLSKPSIWGDITSYQWTDKEIKSMNQVPPLIVHRVGNSALDSIKGTTIPLQGE